MKRWFFITMILTLSVATLAEAETFTSDSREGRWDFSIMTRYSWAQDVTGENGASVKIDSDLGWGFGFSNYLSEAFKLGVVFAWHSTYYDATAVNSDNPDGTYTYSNVLATSSLALAGDYLIGSGRFKPYLSGNLGWMKANTNITADVDGECWYYPYAGYVCGTSTSTYGSDGFTYGLGLGLRLELSPSAFLKIGWEHSWVDLDAYDGNDVLRVDIGFLL